VKRAVVLGAAWLVLGLAVAATPAGATNECNGLRVCVRVTGPWVVVPTSNTVPRPTVEYRLPCPKGYVAGGLDAELSQRAIDVAFLATLGSPVNPGVSTGRSVVFTGRYVGTSPHGPTFRPHVGCMPTRGGGGRIPTVFAGATVFAPGQPTIRRVREVRVRPGGLVVAQACARRERLVDAWQAIGFYTRTPPGESLTRSVQATLLVHGNRAVATVKADAELAGVRAVVQVQALCSGAA
jgi:hypothetical protein